MCAEILFWGVQSPRTPDYPIRSMKHFSVSADEVALPSGAYTKARRLNVLWRGRHITSLSQGEFRSYLYPVYTPAGVPVTTEIPLDHPHHNSVWFAADHVNCLLPFAGDKREEANYNFYLNEIFQGRGPGRILSRDIESVERSEGHLEIKQSLDWQGPVEWGAPEGRRLAIETRTFDIRPNEQANVIDIRSELQAAEWELRIGPTRHGYFGLRLADPLRETVGGTWIDSAGRQGTQAIHNQVADWVDASAVFVHDVQAGVAVFPQPPANDLPWFTKPWGTICVNPLLNAAIGLRPGETYTLSLRLIVHDGDARKAQIAEAYQWFRKQLE